MQPEERIRRLMRALELESHRASVTLTSQRNATDKRAEEVQRL